MDRKEHIVKVVPNKIELWTEVFNPPEDWRGVTPIFLVSGLAAPTKIIPDAWCEELATVAPVVRFDYRDIGRSTHYRFSKNPYQLIDLAHDVIAIMDYYKIDKVHLVCFSFGSVVGQLVANLAKHRIATLSLIMGTTDLRPIFQKNQEIQLWQTPPTNLSPPKFPVMEFFHNLKLHIINSKKEYVNKTISFLFMLHGKGEGFGKEFWRNVIEMTYDHQPSIHFHSTFIHNHFLACLMSNRCFQEPLIDLDTLIIHGDNDPLFPLDHGRATANLHQSPLVVIKGMGHVINHHNFIEIFGYLKNFLSIN